MDKGYKARRKRGVFFLLLFETWSPVAQTDFELGTEKTGN